ncbi:MAG: F0F1 ATP synthase subunit epsilon [Planctomycetota bacterium]
MKCAVLTPNSSLFAGEADAVTLPDFRGAMTVLPRHAPLLGALGVGHVVVRTGGSERRFAVEEGYFEVDRKGVTVLAARAWAPADLTREAVRARLAAAESVPVRDKADFERKLAGIERVRNLGRLVPPPGA